MGLMLLVVHDVSIANSALNIASADYDKFGEFNEKQKLHSWGVQGYSTLNLRASSATSRRPKVLMAAIIAGSSLDRRQSVRAVSYVFFTLRHFSFFPSFLYIRNADLLIRPPVSSGPCTLHSGGTAALFFRLGAIYTRADGGSLDECHAPTLFLEMNPKLNPPLTIANRLTDD